MHTLDLQIRRIKGGFIVTYQMDEPLSHKWRHEEEYAATIQEAINKIVDFANSLDTIKKLAPKD